MENRISQEQDFIEQSRLKAGLTTPNDTSSHRLSAHVKARPWYKRYSSWSVLSMIVPFVLVSVFLMGINSIEQTMGVDSLRWLISSGKVQFVDAGWMKNLIQVYDYRWPICLGIFIFFTAISILLMYLEYKRAIRETSEDEE